MLSPVASQLVDVLPSAWRGTTFKNDHLLGREGFAANLAALLVSKEAAGAAVSTADLTALGNAEDYLRVATNVSTTLEYFLAREVGYGVSEVFTFASATMGVVSVALTAGGAPVHLYLGGEAAPFDAAALTALLALLGATLVCHGGAPSPSTRRLSWPRGASVVLCTEAFARSAGSAGLAAAGVDGFIAPNVLYIANAAKIAPAPILVMRKRLTTPLTTPAAESALRAMAGVAAPAVASPSAAELAEFHAHLQTLTGTAVNPAANPVVFTAGLPTMASLWLTLISRYGGADVVMASTAYGGSSQLCDIVAEACPTLTKHTFDIQGKADISANIRAKLAALSADGGALLPVTVLCVEIPTNPDMKVPNMAELAVELRQYERVTGKRAILLVDATFAPNSRVMRQVRDVAPELSVQVFLSMSKSVSRGVTTAGCLVANHTPFATAVLDGVRSTAALLDTTAKPDQLRRLVDNHVGVEERCDKAYAIACAVGSTLLEAVKLRSGRDMPNFAFVSPEQAALGFTSSTFSFNLPPPTGATPEARAALAQSFVDLLTLDSRFKPCVSFGQDNGLVYCTVPATSTQGAIKEADKSKQAMGGVQLVRLSFPPTIDVAAISAVITGAVDTIYKQL